MRRARALMMLMMSSFLRSCRRDAKCAHPSSTSGGGRRSNTGTDAGLYRFWIFRTRCKIRQLRILINDFQYELIADKSCTFISLVRSSRIRSEHAQTADGLILFCMRPVTT